MLSFSYRLVVAQQVRTQGERGVNNDGAGGANTPRRQPVGQGVPVNDENDYDLFRRTLDRDDRQANVHDRANNTLRTMR